MDFFYNFFNFFLGVRRKLKYIWCRHGLLKNSEMMSKQKVGVNAIYKGKDSQILENLNIEN